MGHGRDTSPDASASGKVPKPWEQLRDVWGNQPPLDPKSKSLPLFHSVTRSLPLPLPASLLPFQLPSFI